MLGMLRAPALLAVLLLHIIACATDDPAVATTFDPLTLFPAQATYVWDDRVSSVPETLRSRQLDFDAVLKEAADEEFSARGYRPVAPGPAHYRLSYEVLVTSWYGSNNTRAVGSLSLFLADATTRRRVWTGMGRADVHVGLTRDERKARLRESLARMLENFPPAQRGE